MSILPALKYLACAAFMGVTALPATGETFAVKLGATTLGTLKYASNVGSARLVSQLNNTPLGVFNGSFTGTSKSISAAREFVGVSKSSRKDRTVTVQIADGRATMTKVTPEDELTALSNPAKVPAGVVDPVVGVGLLASARSGCPDTVTIYDGRRVIALSPAGSALEGQVLTCEVAYRVIAGPGHLSPLKISSAKMQLVYAKGAGPQDLRRISLKSGIFAVVLDRTD